MSRLPTPGSDDNTWGDILNDFLGVEHNPDGTLKKAAVITGAEQATNKGEANGYAPLDNGGKVPQSNLPATVVTGDATTSDKGVVRLNGDLSGTASFPTVPALASKANDSAVVHKTGDETIAGVKTFSSAPVVPANSFPESAVNNLTSDLAAKAPIHNPTFTGTVTLPGDPVTNLEAATKQYTDAAISAGAPDATTTNKGIVQLAGDLAGTATAPTVPGLASKVPTSRLINTGSGLSGGGDLSADRSLSVDTTVVATLNGTQTLTNKTLTSPVVNTPTGIVKGDVGLGNVDNTSDATKNSAVATLTNKDLTSSTNNVTARSLKSATTTVDVSAATAPSSGQVLTATSGTAATWQTAAGNMLTSTYDPAGVAQQLVGTTAVQTLSNKTLTTPTISATGFTNAQHAHTGATSGGQLDHTTALTNVGTNTHAQVDTHIAATAAHGATGAVVGTTNTQTLTNKTLTSPVINTPTGIVKGDVGLGNVDNTSDATKNSATATLTNKTLVSPILQGVALIALTDAATITTDASLGNIFTVTLGGNRTIANPTNPTIGQKIIYRLKQDATGSRTVGWGAVFRFGTDVTTPVLTTTANKTDYIGFIYNFADTTWDCVAVARGY